MFNPIATMPGFLHACFPSEHILLTHILDLASLISYHGLKVSECRIFPIGQNRPSPTPPLQHLLFCCITTLGASFNFLSLINDARLRHEIEVTSSQDGKAGPLLPSCCGCWWVTRAYTRHSLNRFAYSVHTTFSLPLLQPLPTSEWFAHQCHR